MWDTRLTFNQICSNRDNPSWSWWTEQKNVDRFHSFCPIWKFRVAFSKKILSPIFLPLWRIELACFVSPQNCPKKWHLLVCLGNPRCRFPLSRKVGGLKYPREVRYTWVAWLPVGERVKGEASRRPKGK